MGEARFRSIDDRKIRVIEAGADAIRSRGIDWASALTYDRLERASGVDRSQINRDFGNKANLVAAVIRHSISLDASDISDYLDRIEATLSDPSIPISDALLRLGKIEDEFMQGGRRVFAQMLLWAAAGENPEIAAQIRQFYGSFDRRRTAIFERTVLPRLTADGYTMRKNLTLDELTTVATAIAEGLSIRAAIDPDAVPAHLSGQLYQLLVGAMFDPPAPTGDAAPGTAGTDSMP